MATELELLNEYRIVSEAIGRAVSENFNELAEYLAKYLYGINEQLAKLGA